MQVTAGKIDWRRLSMPAFYRLPEENRQSHYATPQDAGDHRTSWGWFVPRDVRAGD